MLDAEQQQQRQLLRASEEGNLAKVKELLDRKVNVNWADPDDVSDMLDS